MHYPIIKKSIFAKSNFSCLFSFNPIRAPKKGSPFYHETVCEPPLKSLFSHSWQIFLMTNFFWFFEPFFLAKIIGRDKIIGLKNQNNRS